MSDTTLLHRSSTTGQWVPCNARKRKCPRTQHVLLDATGTQSELLNDVLAYQQLKQEKKALTVDEQIAEVERQMTMLAEGLAPAHDKQKVLWKQLRNLTTQKWEAEGPHDYVGEGDYEGVQLLMRDANDNSAANNYLRRYAQKLGGPLLRYAGMYDGRYMLPSFEITAPYNADASELDMLSEGMLAWSGLVLANRENPSNKKYGYRSEHDGSEMTADEGMTFKVFDRGSSEEGIPMVRVFSDGTAQTEMLSYGRTHLVDVRGYRMHGSQEDSERKPLREVLTAMNKFWYYPAESHPNYREPSYDDDDYGYSGDY